MSCQRLLGVRVEIQVISMKYKPKDIKKLGRVYGKRAFQLNENDFIELSIIERAYYAGYKQARKQLIDNACDQLCKTCYVGERNKYKQCEPCQCEGGDFYNLRKAMEE